MTLQFPQIGDLLAIPFFFLLALYFYRKPHKTQFEMLLFLFAITGFVADISFTYMWSKPQTP